MYCTLLMIGMLFLVPESGPGASDPNVSRPLPPAREEERSVQRQWAGEDVHLAANEVVSHQFPGDGHVLIFRRGFSMLLGGRQFTSDEAVVWIGSSDVNEPAGYEVRVFLSGDISDKRTDEVQRLDIKEFVIDRRKAVVLQTRIGGELFITTESREAASPAGMPLYARAAAAFKEAGAGTPPAAESATLPGVPPEKEAEEERLGYTVSFAPLGEKKPEGKWTRTEAGEVVTLIGRVYIWWQELNEDTGRTRLLEIEADQFVLWRYPDKTTEDGNDVSATQYTEVGEIYVAGDVLLREGQHTIRAKELYYDLRHQRGVATNAVMRTFDAARNIPVYVRAKELRQLSQGQFEGHDITVTTSEFWTPQVSLEASTVRVVDKTEEVSEGTVAPESSFEAEMKDVRLKYYDHKLLGLPKVQSNLLRPDVPIRSVRVGHDSTFGTSLETQWFLSRILGLREPEGTDSTLSLDYYGDRGPGAGVEIDYEREDYFGRVLGYVIEDHGEDRLGRTRKNVEIDDETRGRFLFQHRHFLPYGWQLTAEASYLSDENFLEQYYRREFNVGKEQETLVHLKRIDENRGVSFLAKTRINDFADQVEEAPSVRYHWTGQSFMNDRLLFFSDNQVSRYRYRYSSEGPSGEPGNFFTFSETRNEIDMPVNLGSSKVVPFVAGTLAYEDGLGFQQELDGDMANEREDAVGIGEVGVRMFTRPFWCVYPDVESRLWDLHQMRHVITPSITAVSYAATDSVAEQRDTLDLGISQRWQTKRGPVGRRRTVDWLELNLDFVWVNNSGDAAAGPDHFLWNRPLIPLANPLGDQVVPLDRRATEAFGPQRNYTSAEMIMRLSDTTSVLGDVYFDMQSGVVEQLDIGFSRSCWPNLSYYVGSRYLRDVETELGQRGSNAVTFAATYVLDPRYTVVFSQQYDFDYDANIRTDITLIRRYHRLNYALTFSVDDSLDEQSVVFSLWPQGVPELGLGLRRYMGLGASDVD